MIETRWKNIQSAHPTSEWYQILNFPGMDRAKAMGCKRYKNPDLGSFWPLCCTCYSIQRPKASGFVFYSWFLVLLPFDYVSQESKQTDGNFIIKEWALWSWTFVCRELKKKKWAFMEAASGAFYLPPQTPPHQDSQRCSGRKTRWPVSELGPWPILFSLTGISAFS